MLIGTENMSIIKYSTDKIRLVIKHVIELQTERYAFYIFKRDQNGRGNMFSVTSYLTRNNPW